MANNASPQYIKISEEDLIEAGVITEPPKIQETKKGPPPKENKFTLIEVDEEYLEQLRNEAKATGTHRQSMVSKRQSGVNNLYNIKKTTTTISRRSSNVKKDITKKTLNNVLKKDVQKDAPLQFIPIPLEILDSLEKEVAKANVRKELFKMPLSKTASDKKSSTRTSTQLSGKFFQAPRSKTKPTINVNNSPLVEMDKVETILKKKSSLMSLEKNPSVQTPSRLSIVEEETTLSPSTSGNTSKNIGDKLRSSTSSNSEFEAMERMCNNEEATKKINSDILKIMQIMKTDQEEFEKYKVAKNQRMAEISTILNEIISKSENGKAVPDNTGNSMKRQSKPKTPKLTPTKSNKSFDLRKNVLSMNLGNTPKEKKAERMYNSLRDKYGILETPKFDKKTPKFDKNTPKSDTKNISERIQEQCLMLLDTPQSKK